MQSIFNNKVFRELINHQRAIKAFEKAGFRIVRQGKHITMKA
ncbi:MAG: hypothetical protein AB4041_20635 [Microcystaceae cyanobacterium]